MYSRRMRKKGEKMSNKKGFTLFELVIALAIIGVIMGVMFKFLHKATIVTKEAALRLDLKSMRQSLILYKAMKGSYPEDLRELIEKHPEDLKGLLEARYESVGSDEALFAEEFLNTAGRDEEGYPVDPFGTKYYYDSRKGVVSSKAEGYEDW